MTALVMELVEGRPSPLVLLPRPLSNDDVLPLARQIAEASKPRTRDHPSRSEAREHQGANRRHRESAGLWPREPNPQAFGNVPFLVEPRQVAVDRPRIHVDASRGQASLTLLDDPRLKRCLGERGGGVCSVLGGRCEWSGTTSPAGRDPAG